MALYFGIDVRVQGAEKRPGGECGAQWQRLRRMVRVWMRTRSRGLEVRRVIHWPQVSGMCLNEDNLSGLWLQSETSLCHRALITQDPRGAGQGSLPL